MEAELRGWAEKQWGRCELKDKRRVARAVEIGMKMSQAPGEGLPKQMGSRSELIGAYRLMNNRHVTLSGLMKPHLSDTLIAAGQRSTGEADNVVLMIHDGSVLDFSGHPKTGGIGSVGSGQQRGMLMHSVLAVTARDKAVLGLAHLEVIVRPEEGVHYKGGQRSTGPEGQVWENGVRTVGQAPVGTTWVHVSDRESDVFEYLALCVDYGCHFVVRGRWNRAITPTPGEAEPESEPVTKLLDNVRRLSAHPSAPCYEVTVDATAKSPKRKAQIALSWGALDVHSPHHMTGEARRTLQINVVRAWEVNPPPGATPVEWILLTSLPVTTADQARLVVTYYECRWLIEDFHMCLKTGCRYEASQLDHALDLQNLLGFAAPIAVRLLQLRQMIRATPDVLADTVIDPLRIRLLTARFKFAAPLTLNQFWLAVARLGGYVGQPLKHPPGWRTLWAGWHTLSTWVNGVHLFAS